VRRRLFAFLGFVAVALSTSTSWATIRFFPDLVAQSPNQRYRVEARSPGNREKRGWVFDSGFTFRCIDTKTNKTLWTRRQATRKVVGEDGPGLGDFTEGFPVGLYVDDSAWVVIRTGWGSLIGVDSTGKDRWKIGIFSELMSKEDAKKYVVHSSAGPIWTGNAMWYFADAGDTKIFVIRPWWGTRMLVDVDEGKIKELDEPLSAALLKIERGTALKVLREGLRNRPRWEGGENYAALRPVLKASYLVGRLGVKEAVPCLRELEDVDIVCSSVSSWSDYRPAINAVSPHTWREFTVRQIVHVSLRRLGEKPGGQPCTWFQIHDEDYDQIRYYETPQLTRPRLEGLAQLTKRMKPEEVLSHVGAPDFVNNGTWYYDMDADEPFTLGLRWGRKGLGEIKKHTPPLWQTEKWDEEFSH
jgi:hypothetical protein